MSLGLGAAVIKAGDGDVEMREDGNDAIGEEEKRMKGLVKI